MRSPWLCRAGLAAVLGGALAATAPGASTEPPALRLDEAENHWSFAADTEGTIEASVYSLPSAFVTSAEAAALLEAVHSGAPERAIVTLTDLPFELSASAEGRVFRLEVTEPSFTPWPRDPVSLVRAPSGAVAVLQRPNLQPGREGDATLGATLAEGWPQELQRRWGEVRWATATVPFHNGQVLLSPEAAWISIHTVELRALEILGLPRVPVASFGGSPGVERYVAAVRQAAGELEALYRRPVRFVHPLPVGAAPEGPALMERLGGGAGFDLDSLLTLLPSPDGGLVALVADVAAGVELARGLPAAELEILGRAYELAAPPGETLRSALAAAQATPRARALTAFLDLMAQELSSQGLAVSRLALLLVPTELLVDGEGAAYQEFLLGWNNAVVERSPGGPLRAEAFASLLPSADAQARRLYREAGVELVLLPPLLESVRRNGGYRCASNHLRAAPATPVDEQPARRRSAASAGTGAPP